MMPRMVAMAAAAEQGDGDPEDFPCTASRASLSRIPFLSSTAPPGSSTSARASPITSHNVTASCGACFACHCCLAWAFAILLVPTDVATVPAPAPAPAAAVAAVIGHAIMPGLLRIRVQTIPLGHRWWEVVAYQDILQQLQLWQRLLPLHSCKHLWHCLSHVVRACAWAGPTCSQQGANKWQCTATATVALLRCCYC